MFCVKLTDGDKGNRNLKRQATAGLYKFQKTWANSEILDRSSMAAYRLRPRRATWRPLLNFAPTLTTYPIICFFGAEVVPRAPLPHTNGVRRVYAQEVQ